MKKTSILMFAVLLCSTRSPAAEESSGADSRAPDPKAFADLLPGGKKEVTNKQGPSVEAPEESLEIDRVLAEASMHLSQIAEKSTACSREAQDVFDEAIDFIEGRLRELELKESQRAAGNKKAVEKKIGAVKAEEPAKGRPVSTASEAVRAVAPVGKDDAARRSPPVEASLLQRWAEQLRAIADQLVEEAGASKSNDN